MSMNTKNAAVAAIQFALETDEGLEFLRLWNHGEFDKTRREWPEAPEDVYIGADPLHPQTVLPSEVDLVDVIAARVQTGKPVYVTGPLDDAQGRLHVAMINRLRNETGKPIHVIHN